jgi:hypothetical protein
MTTTTADDLRTNPIRTASSTLTRLAAAALDPREPTARTAYTKAFSTQVVFQCHGRSPVAGRSVSRMASCGDRPVGSGCWIDELAG